MKSRIEWTTVLFLFFTTLASVTIIPYYAVTHELHLSIILFSFVFAIATNLSITAGYHRLWAHKAYDAARWVKWVYVLIGSAAFQGSVMKWPSDHRRHHSNEDSDKDPYSINKGFFYAHIQWLFFKESADQAIHAPDLANDKLLFMQNRFYPLMAFSCGMIFPALVGWAMGSALEGFLFGGVLRAVLTMHSTFLVNSLAHTWGRRPYSLDITAKDNFVVAILTHGEGYHNFHHKFQYDYRNGIRWYHWDPTKWVIQSLAFFGQAKRLRVVPAADIQKARLAIDQLNLQNLGVQSAHLDELRARIEKLFQDIKHLHAEYVQLKKDFADSSREKARQLRFELRLRKIELQQTMRHWKFEVRTLQSMAYARI